MRVLLVLGIDGPTDDDLTLTVEDLFNLSLVLLDIYQCCILRAAYSKLYMLEFPYVIKVIYVVLVFLEPFLAFVQILFVPVLPQPSLSCMLPL